VSVGSQLGPSYRETSESLTGPAMTNGKLLRLEDEDTSTTHAALALCLQDNGHTPVLS
jgi:hypothetical protein